MVCRSSQASGLAEKRYVRIRDPVAPIRVPLGRRCSVRIEFAEESDAGVSVQWRTNPSSTVDRRPEDVFRHVAVPFANE